MSYKLKWKHYFYGSCQCCLSHYLTQLNVSVTVHYILRKFPNGKKIVLDRQRGLMYDKHSIHFSIESGITEVCALPCLKNP